MALLYWFLFLHISPSILTSILPFAYFLDIFRNIMLNVTPHCTYRNVKHYTSLYNTYRIVKHYTSLYNTYLKQLYLRERRYLWRSKRQSRKQGQLQSRHRLPGKLPWYFPLSLPFFLRHTCLHMSLPLLLHIKIRKGVGAFLMSYVHSFHHYPSIFYYHSHIYPTICN
jgi:hypothetical protein